MRNDQPTGESVNIDSADSRISGIFDSDFAVAVEALLFASPDPLDEKEIARIIGSNRRQIQSIIDELNQKYVEWGRSFRIEKFGGRYRFYTLPEYDRFISRLADLPRPVKLSRAALEVLSIVAYRQPTVRSEIERIRGVNPDGVIRNLLEKGLIEVCGRSDGPGRPLLYGTTRDFLEFFGISDVSELPDPDTINEPETVRNLVLKKPAERVVDTDASGDEAQ